MLKNESQPAATVTLESSRVAELGVQPATPHWSLVTHEQLVFFRSPASESVPLQHLPFDHLTAPDSQQQLQPTENFAPIVTRLPPVNESVAEHSPVPALALSPMPDRGVPASPVSVRRPAKNGPQQPASPQPAAIKKATRAAKELKLPGQEFGVGTVTSVRFKEGLAVLEFENSAIIPPGAVIRAYHEFALSGRSPVCDLEVVDGADGRTVVVARSGSQLTALNVGDQAVVLQ